MCLGTLGKVVERWDVGDIPMAKVATDRGEQAASLMYHPGVAVGADVLTHMGFVADVLDPERAADARSLRGGEAA